jgi:tRNA(Ile)-lysidine synthase
VSKYIPPPNDLLAISNSLLACCPIEDWHERAVEFLNCQDDHTLGIACSGGADSTFALLLVYALFPRLRDKMVVLHYNHKLREDSDKDERFVVELAEKLELPHEVGQSVKASKEDEGSLREQRLGFFFKVCERRNASRLIQGHNQDDVAETILWRLSRGSSPQGLCAPRPIHQHENLCLIRPFITIDRAKIREMLSHANMPWCEDESNDSPEYLRNRIRMNSLNRLKDDVDRDLLQGMTRSRDLLEEQEDAIQEWTIKASKECLCDGTLNIDQLAGFPKAIRRRVVSDWLMSDQSIDEISTSQLNKILKSLEDGVELGISLSINATIRVIDSRLVLEKTPRQVTGWARLALPPNQRLYLPGGKSVGFTIKKASAPLIEQIIDRKVDQLKEAYCSHKRSSEPLFARTRLPGDDYRPIGSPGRKKLKAWMIDRKFDQITKDSTPLILDSNGEIIWVPGFAPAETQRVDESDRLVIHLTYY